MEHNHSHDHIHLLTLTKVNSSLITGIVLNSLFVVIEAVIGFSIHSLSLLSDAGHNLADVGSLALSLLAFRLLKVKANDKYTYGYRKTTILAALTEWRYFIDICWRNSLRRHTALLQPCFVTRKNDCVGCRYWYRGKFYHRFFIYEKPKA